MKTSKRPFGEIDGIPVTLYTITNQNGYELSCMDYGATLVSFSAPDRDGNAEVITLGYDELEPYASKHPFFGSTVGRVANRIGGGRYTYEGKTYNLDRNEGENTLHGGSGGFHVKFWTGRPFERATLGGVIFHLESPAGDQGFPGKLGVTVTFTLTEENELVFEYRAESDEATPVSLTNHTYWNLNGAPDLKRASGTRYPTPAEGGAIGDHRVVIYGSEYVELGDSQIPTGTLASVPGSLMDFTGEHAIGERVEEAGGYDFSYVLDVAEEELNRAAFVKDPESGRAMEVSTTCPAVQFYSGEKLEGVPGRNGQRFRKRDALCLETQYHPDAVNHATFPSIMLQPGEVYQEKTIHTFSTL